MVNGPVPERSSVEDSKYVTESLVHLPDASSQKVTKHHGINKITYECRPLLPTERHEFIVCLWETNPALWFNWLPRVSLAPNVVMGVRGSRCCALSLFCSILSWRSRTRSAQIFKIVLLTTLVVTRLTRSITLLKLFKLIIATVVRHIPQVAS